MIVFFNILEIFIVLLPILMAVAFVTIAERKVMGAMQRRCGPNAVGVWGLLQPFKASEWYIKNKIYYLYKKIRLYAEIIIMN